MSKILTFEGGLQTAKSYPYWEELYALLKDNEVKKIGMTPLSELKDLIEWCDVFISIDSFPPHFIEYHKIDKKVIVLWGTSHPEIFGYENNVNLLKDKKYLREQPYKWWKEELLNKDAFVSPNNVFKHV